ncbi:hypothetical protein Tco_0145077 [Tanacetum coccineum]
MNIHFFTIFILEQRLLSFHRCACCLDINKTKFLQNLSHILVLTDKNTIILLLLLVVHKKIESNTEVRSFRPNGDALRKCILKGPYTPTIVTTPAVPATENSPAVPEQTTVETVMNMTPENRAHFESEKEAIHLILTGIGDEIYLTVDAFNELRAERMAKNANPLALVATAQTLQDPYYQTSKPHKSYAPTSKASLPTRSHATTRYKGKEIANPITPPSESASEEDSDPEQAQKDKYMHKTFGLSLQSTSRTLQNLQQQPQKLPQKHQNMNVDTNPSNKEYHHTDSLGKKNQRAVNVLANRETVGGPVVQQFLGYSCSLQESNLTEASNTDEEIDKQSWKHITVPCTDPGVPNADHELILIIGTILYREANIIRDSCLVCTSKYNRQLRGLLAQKEIDIKEGLKVKAYEISVVKEKHDELVKQSLLTKSHYEGLVKEKTKVITDLKLKEEKDIDKMISMENQIKFLNEIVYKRSQSIQTIHMLAPKCPTFNGRPTFANPRYLKKAQNEISCLYAIPHDQSDPANRLVPQIGKILDS